MATVNQLVEQVARETGLDDSSGSDERAIVVSSLSRAYRRIVGIEAKRTLPGTHDETAALDIDLSAEVPSLVTVDSVHRIDGSRLIPLDRTTPERLLEMRGSSGTPTAYAVVADQLMLDAVEDDNPSTLRLYYTSRPSELVDGGTEASIDGIDPVYHEDLLGNLAAAYILEGYEGEEERAAGFRMRADQTLSQFKRDQIRRGGVYEPRGDDVGRFDTPGPRGAR